MTKIQKKNTCGNTGILLDKFYWAKKVMAFIETKTKTKYRYHNFD